MGLLTAELPAEILTAWDLTQVRSVSRVAGGELKEVYRLDLGDHSLALSLYRPETTPAMVASELAWVTEFAAQLPEVPRPIPTSDGARLFVEQTGRVAVLSEFIRGEHPDRMVATHRHAAAEMLAQLHEIASNIKDPQPRPCYPAWSELDWRENQWWVWSRVQRFLHDSDLNDVPDIDSAKVEERLAKGLEPLPSALLALARLDLPAIPIHNDYFEGNLLYRDGRIFGVVDWDEARLDWRAWDIGNATWSFSRASEEHRMDALNAKAFLGDYESAGGEITDDERRVLVQLIRVRLLWETLYELGKGCLGYKMDWHYLYGNLTALDGFSEEYLDSLGGLP